MALSPTIALSINADVESEPVSNAEADLFLRLTAATATADSNLIDAMITAARQYAESFTGRATTQRTYDLFLDCFPDVIELPMPPLSSVDSITYTDENGSSQTLSASVYTVDTDSEPGRVYLAYGQSWPGTYGIPKAVRVRYVAGYSDADSVPAPLKTAILMMVADMYENREAQIVGVGITPNPTVERLLYSQKVPVVV